MVDDTNDRRMHGFERLLTLWVALAMGAGILLGRLAPGFAKALDGITLDVDGAPVVSIPIAICLFFMMYPIMVKIDFTEVVAAGKSTYVRLPADALRQLVRQAIHDARDLEFLPWYPVR